jgi:SAM-dependent methyltransferase
MVSNWILNILRLPENAGIDDPDNPDNIFVIRKIIQKKSFLKRIYQEYYYDILKRIQNAPANGHVIELGSGGGFLKKIAPQVITTDILAYEGIDLVFSALEMPFLNSSVSAFVMFDVLHHIKDSRLFFKEMSRALKPDGKIVMIEPANTLWSRFIYQNFHHEPFLVHGIWGFEEGGPLSGANMAIPWIIFFRDSNLFAQEFPELSVCDINIHTPFRYLLSGGLSMRQLCPSWSYPLVKGMELCLTPLNNFLGMFMTIELSKLS